MNTNKSTVIGFSGRHGMGESGFSCWGVEGVRARVILVLRECIWNASTVSLVLPAFDDTGSLGFHPRGVGNPSGSTLDDCLPFFYGE